MEWHIHFKALRCGLWEYNEAKLLFSRSTLGCSIYILFTWIKNCCFNARSAKILKKVVPSAGNRAPRARWIRFKLSKDIQQRLPRGQKILEKILELVRPLLEWLEMHRDRISALESRWQEQSLIKWTANETKEKHNDELRSRLRIVRT